MKTRQFLDQLQAEAKFQAQLRNQPLLPRQLDPITSIIGNYPWQTIVLISGITALVIEVLR
jgi:hypothetical protein